MEIATIATIISGILAILSGVLGTKYKKYKDVAKEIIDSAETVMNAIEDDNVSEEELRNISKKIRIDINKNKKK